MHAKSSSTIRPSNTSTILLRGGWLQSGIHDSHQQNNARRMLDQHSTHTSPTPDQHLTLPRKFRLGRRTVQQASINPTDRYLCEPASEGSPLRAPAVRNTHDHSPRISIPWLRQGTRSVRRERQTPSSSPSQHSKPVLSPPPCFGPRTSFIAVQNVSFSACASPSALFLSNSGQRQWRRFALNFTIFSLQQVGVWFRSEAVGR